MSASCGCPDHLELTETRRTLQNWLEKRFNNKVSIASCCDESRALQPVVECLMATLKPPRTKARNDHSSIVVQQRSRTTKLIVKHTFAGAVYVEMTLDVPLASIVSDLHWQP